MTDDSLVREAHHRCGNDLQLVVSLLQLTARQQADDELAARFLEIANRVRLLARARGALAADLNHSLVSALRDVCEALQAMAEPRGIIIALALEAEPRDLGIGATTAISMAVNELATNAIKHAFVDRDQGRVSVKLGVDDGGKLLITVEDDGKPLDKAPSTSGDKSRGMGLTLARRLLEQHEGKLIPPCDGTKAFRIVVDQGLAVTSH